MRLLIATIALLLLGGTAFAQEDAMEAQRCIHRCLYNSNGADDPAYLRCAEKRCGFSSEKPKKRSKPQKRSEETSPGRWSYGEHPRLGLSAYVDVGSEAYGLACPARGDTGRAGPAVAERFTSGLSPSKKGPGQLTYVWNAPFGIGGDGVYEAAGDLFQRESDYCSSHAPQVRASGAMLLLRENFKELSSDERGARMVVDGKDGEVTIASADDIEKLESPIEIPLSGASKAIAALARACPPLRVQMADGCDME